TWTGRSSCSPRPRRTRASRTRTCGPGASCGRGCPTPTRWSWSSMPIRPSRRPTRTWWRCEPRRGPEPAHGRGPSPYRGTGPLWRDAPTGERTLLSAFQHEDGDAPGGPRLVLGVVGEGGDGALPPHVALGPVHLAG